MIKTTIPIMVGDSHHNFLATQRVAVVTGGNKGIGLEICRKLASMGIMVVLTARDEKKGFEAMEILKASAHHNHFLFFHQLDVMDPTSISSLVHFVKTRFQKNDILVNNAAVTGAIVDSNALRILATIEVGEYIDWSKVVSSQTYNLAEECLRTNYYGAKRVAEALMPLLNLSDSPRIVNVSSSSGKLKYVCNEWAVRILSDAENLTEERVDEVLNKFLKDFKENRIEAKGWPLVFSAYTMSKAGLNAYTRIMAKKCPSLMINSVCPGFVKTDLTCNLGFSSVEEGASAPVWLALLPPGDQSGLFFSSQKVVTDF